MLVGIWFYWYDYLLFVEFEVERIFLNGIRKYLVRDMKVFIFFVLVILDFVNLF